MKIIKYRLQKNKIKKRKMIIRRKKEKNKTKINKK